MDIANWIIGHRIKLGWTQAQLAHELESDAQAVSRWERGICVPSTLQLRRLCLALGASSDEALGLPVRRRKRRAA